MNAEDFPWYAPHLAWLRGEEANGRRADLQGADIRSADLQGADIRRAYLQGADLRSAYLQGADLRGADLGGANLRGADLRGADLRGAYLQGAYLQGGAYNAATRWPSQTMVLLSRWGSVPASLCRDLMRYDAANHPDPAAFGRWAAGGSCPYAVVSFERSADFAECSDLWDPALLAGPPKSAMELVQALFAEHMRLEE